MNRRSFLQRTAPFIALPMVLHNNNVSALAQPFLPAGFVQALTRTDKVLVIVQMNGGNDGINTVIARDQYSAYMNMRANVAIPEGSVLPLTTATGLHPAMTAFKSMYDEGKLAVVQGVSYPSPNFSHFRATDIWNTASHSHEMLRDGWLGRYMDYEFPGFPSGYPNASMQDPLAIQIGSSLTLALQGEGGTMGIAVSDPNNFATLVGGTDLNNFDPMPNTHYGDIVAFTRQVQLESNAYAGRIKSAVDRAPNRAQYPTGSLASQLRWVARMIAGGLQTRVYVVSQGGYDTHATQVANGDNTIGSHANLLQHLSQSIASFQNDLKMYGVEDRVIGMTFSEFGRRPFSNGSMGTDHGTAAPVFLFGKNITPGVFGANPNYSNLLNFNLRMTYDFRQIYSSVMTQWFGVGQADLSGVMLRDFIQLPLVRPADSLTMEVVKKKVLSPGQSFTVHLQTIDEEELPAGGNVTVFDTLQTPVNRPSLQTGDDGLVSYNISVPQGTSAGRYPVYFGLSNGFFSIVEIEVP